MTKLPPAGWRPAGSWQFRHSKQLAALGGFAEAGTMAWAWPDVGHNLGRLFMTEKPACYGPKKMVDH